MRSYELELPVKLNEVQIVVKGKLLANYALKSASLDAEIEDVRGVAKEQIKALKEDLIAVRKMVGKEARAIRKGVEIGPLKVEARVADDNSRVDVVRVDTGELVETRALTDDDRQMQIDEVLARVEEETKAVEREEEAPADLDEDDEGDEDGL